MKRATILFAAILLVAVAATAQNPKLSYSAVVRNSANELVANQTVTVAVSIANSETGSAVYAETHTVTTNPNGLVTLTIGDGTVVGGDLADVDWRKAHITTQYTLPDGSLLVSTMPVNAVPYALYADNISPESLLGAVSAMTDEQKAALKEALGVTGGGEEPAAFTCGTSTVNDHEGNVYNTVQIGTQCWTKENMRCTTSPSTGTYIVNNTSDQHTYTGKMAKWYNNDSATYAPKNYGLLYNWNAAVDTFNDSFEETSVNTDYNNAVSALFAGNRRGICPEGWHIPSDAEWTTLTDYVSANFACEDNSANIAKALASTTEDWHHNDCGDACYPCDQSVTPNNASGFGAVPAGYCIGSSFRNAGRYATFWSSTENYSSNAWYRSLYYYDTYVDRGSNYKDYGRSVRCLRD